MLCLKKKTTKLRSDFYRLLYMLVAFTVRDSGGNGNEVRARVNLISKSSFTAPKCQQNVECW